jgi:hypothetical protein
MKAIKTYSTTVDADLAKVTLLAAGIGSVVVGAGVPMRGNSSPDAFRQSPKPSPVLGISHEA